MRRAQIDMTNGRLGRDILLFSLPLMLSNILQVLFNMADLATVGQFVSSHALGSVGSTVILVSLFTGFLIGMGSGVNVIAARYLGARQGDDVSQTVHTAALLCLFAGVAALAIGEFFAVPLLRLIHTKDELIVDATLYLRIYFLGMPALAVYNFGNGVLSATGDTKRPLIILASAGVLNVVLNLFFVVVCGLGVAGVGIASAASQWLSAVLVVLALSKREDACRFMPQALRITPDKARLLLSMGVPAGFQNAIFAIANLFIQSGVNSFDAIVVDGNSAAANADSLVYDVMAAFYIACSTFMSQNLGAGRRKRVLQSYFVSLAYSFGAGAVLGALLLLFGRQFLALFTPDSAVIDEGIRRLQVMAFSYAFSAFMDNTIAASRGLGKSLVPTSIVMMGSCVFRVVWIYTVFAHFHTLPSLYLLYIFSWTITAVAEILYFVHCYRAQINRPGLSGGELSKAQ
ncbi:MAG: MATE family efflux transporter [Clostridiales bacterium]|nr:MATE family efflux transporter [Clostridiales bacterium]